MGQIVSIACIFVPTQKKVKFWAVIIMEAKTKRASGRGLYAEGDENPHEHDGTVLETKNPTGTKKLYNYTYGCQSMLS